MIRSGPSPKLLFIPAIRMTTDILMTGKVTQIDTMLICFLVLFLLTPVDPAPPPPADVTTCLLNDIKSVTD